MTQQPILKIGTALVGLVLAGLIGSRLINDAGSGTSTSKQSPVLPLTLKSFGGAKKSSNQDVQILAQVDREKNQVARPITGTLRLGRIGVAPSLKEIQHLQRLPLLDSQMNRAYGLAKSMTCRMLTPGASVKPTISLPEVGQSVTIGRVPAITVGLTMDPSGRHKLPAVTRGQVDDYFEKHRLSIQPTVYGDEDGKLYFGTDCQAAFYEINRPGIAIKAEPMIESAVERFRSLGIAASDHSSETDVPWFSNALDTGRGRTLVMAFSFEKSDLTISAVAANRNVNELLFFHLPPIDRESSGGSGSVKARDAIAIEVFLTSEERRTLHRLDLSDRDLNSPDPHILADVRFDKMILMGMYPAEPVVTEIRYRSAGVISMELVSELLSGYKQQASLSLDEVLDQFGLLSRSLDANDSKATAKSDGTDDDDQRWLKEVARDKYDRLKESLKPIEREDSNLDLPKVPLMTGVGK